MQINTRYNSGTLSSLSGSSDQGSETAFGAILAKASQTLANNGVANGTATSMNVVKTAAEKKKEAAQQEYESVLAEFRDYMKKTPIEHMRDAILKEMGLSEEELAALPPEQHDAIEAEIGRRIKERLLGQEEGKADDATLAALGNHGSSTQATSGLFADPGNDVLAQQLAAVLAASAPGAQSSSSEA
ncbi:hypothetical protein DLREEDagrD3_04050 [Denitratisoma sp. agr-D3]